jgi:hypothetical protein
MATAKTSTTHRDVSSIGGHCRACSCTNAKRSPMPSTGRCRSKPTCADCGRVSFMCSTSRTVRIAAGCFPSHNVDVAQAQQLASRFAAQTSHAGPGSRTPALQDGSGTSFGYPMDQRAKKRPEEKERRDAERRLREKLWPTTRPVARPTKNAGTLEIAQRYAAGRPRR